MPSAPSYSRISMRGVNRGSDPVALADLMLEAAGLYEVAPGLLPAVSLALR